MEYQIEVENWPESDLLDQYVDNHCYNAWQRDKTKPPFGEYTFLYSWIKPGKRHPEIIIGFDLRVNIPLEAFNHFLFSMQKHGWRLSDKIDEFEGCREFQLAKQVVRQNGKLRNLVKRKYEEEYGEPPF